jgi:hypothetical protein
MDAAVFVCTPVPRIEVVDNRIDWGVSGPDQGSGGNGRCTSCLDTNNRETDSGNI